MRFEPGDRVRVLNEPMEGIVMRSSGDCITIEHEGLEFDFQEKELVKVEYEPLDLYIPKTPKEALERKKKKTTATGPKAVPEIDLHIHELMEYYAHLSNTEIVLKQIGACKAFLHSSLAKGFRKMVIVHGVGEGVLRSEVHRLLDGFPNLQYHDAPYRKYGHGATEVVVLG